MGQVTIYLDEETEAKARAAAHAEGLSLSRWVADRIRPRALDQWPASVRELAGAWEDLPSAEEIRRGLGRDTRRRRL
jgi:hypothetical protein